MTASPPLSFEAIAYRLRQRGILITSLPGEFSVNYLDGKPETAETRETLPEALELAEAMAQNAPAAAVRTAQARRPKRRLSMRPKAIIKRRIRAHNRRRRARAIKAQGGDA
jgi:hypothetical protein